MKRFFTIRDVVWVFAGVFVLTVLGEFILGEIPYFANMNATEIGGVDFVIVYLIQTLIVLLPLLLVMGMKKIRFKELGFVKTSFQTVVKLALMGYIAYFVIMAIIIQVIWYLQIEVPGFGQQESHMDFLGGENIGAVVVVLIITFLAPLIEEVFFRGFVFQTMLGKWPSWVAFIVSAVIFAGIHFEFQVFMPLFLLGLILNWMFFKSKSLYPGIAFHIINNVIALGLEYYIYSHPEVMEMVEGFIRF